MKMEPCDFESPVCIQKRGIKEKDLRGGSQHSIFSASKRHQDTWRPDTILLAE